MMIVMLIMIMNMKNMISSPSHWTLPSFVYKYKYQDNCEYNIYLYICIEIYKYMSNTNEIVCIMPLNLFKSYHPLKKIFEQHSKCTQIFPPCQSYNSLLAFSSPETPTHKWKYSFGCILLNCLGQN